MLKSVNIVDGKFLQDLQDALEDVKNGNISKATTASKIIGELGLEAQQMIDEYNSNPELIELSNSVEDIVEYNSNPELKKENT